MSLQAFFDQKAQEGFKFIVRAGTGKDPVLVKLGDE